MLNLIKKTSDFLNKFIANLCLIFMVGMTFVVLLGVFFRYVLMSPLSWTEELSRYMMIWAASLAVSIGVKEKGHVGLTVLLDRVNTKISKFILDTIIFLTTFTFLIIMIYYSIKMVIDAKWQISQGLGITMILPTLAIPVSMSVALIQLIFVYILNIFTENDVTHEKEIIDI
jgi:TRAP-type C4-dicarboxylate transport system permease small subunit